jgi:hypothetical protein
MGIVGAGAINHRKLCNLADRYFSGLRTEINKEQRKSGPVVCLDEEKFVGSDVR